MSGARRRNSRLTVAVRGSTETVARLLRRAARCTAAEEFRPARPRARRAGPLGGSISIAVVSDPEMARHNVRWLRHKGPTDVLTFDLGGDPSAGMLDGEIIVSRDTARREALHRGHPTAQELALYVVHGVLHLLGHDDHRPADRRRMRAAERAVLASMGMGGVE